MNNSNVTAFTGHRYVNGLTVNEDIKRVSLKLIKRGVTHFMVGGALGFDILAGEKIIKIREEKPDIKLIVVLPCCFDIFTQKWEEVYKKRIAALMMNADEVITLQDEFTNDCYKKRNQYLVDHSGVCVCYYNINQSRTGTGQTVRMAERKGIEIINIFEVRSKKNEQEKR
jgi:uncharacterized phage-like protein YoqJ